MTIKFNLYVLGEKHLTYDLEDHWSCTTPQLERLVADVLEQVALQIDGIASCSYAGQAPSISTIAKVVRSRKP